MIRVFAYPVVTVNFELEKFLARSHFNASMALVGLVWCGCKKHVRGRVNHHLFGPSVPPASKKADAHAAGKPFDSLNDKSTASVPLMGFKLLT